MENENERRISAFSELWKEALSIPEADDHFLETAHKIGKAWACLGLPDSFDPLNDFVLLLRLHPSITSIEAGQWERRDESFINGLARYATLAAPGWSEKQWRAVVSSCLGARYGGTRVRIKKRPSKEKLQDAKTLTPKQLMEKHGISRSYAYKLLNQNRTKK